VDNTVVDSIAAPKNNTSMLYVGIRGGHLLVTTSLPATPGTDPNPTWFERNPVPLTQQTIDLNYADIEVDPDDANTAYVVAANFSDVTGGGHVWMTTDAGVHWKDISGNLPDKPVWSIQLDKIGMDKVLYVGTDVGVFVSSNLGATWSRFGSGLPNVQVRAMDLNRDLNQLLVGTWGRGAYRITPLTPPVTSNVTGGVLSITAHGADAIAVTAHAGHVKVNGSDPGTGPAAANTITTIIVQALGDFNNTVNLSSLSPADFTVLSSVSVDGGAGDDFLVGSQWGETLMGNSGSDTILGGGGHDLLQGDPGDDIIFGGAGRDTIHGDEGDDILRGGGGADVLRGGDGFDMLFGNAGNDVLRGGDGHDRLLGGVDNDQLNGGRDNDRLNGGPGIDFVNGGQGFNRARQDRLDFFANIDAFVHGSFSLFGPTYSAFENLAEYGFLDQYLLNSRHNFIGNEACGPTSSVNAMIYLQNRFPGIYGTQLTGGSSIYEWENTADLLISPDYMDTQPATPGDPGSGGTTDGQFFHGLRKYIVETLGFAQTRFTQQGLVTNKDPSWQFLYKALRAKEALIIAIEYTGGGGHFLVMYGLDWTDRNGDGVIQKSENAVAFLLDNLDPSLVYSPLDTPVGPPKPVPVHIWNEPGHSALHFAYNQYQGGLPYQADDYEQVIGTISGALAMTAAAH
jgi:hypothetical protein